MLGSPAGGLGGGGTQRTTATSLWPPPSPNHHIQQSHFGAPISSSAEALGRYGLYSVFPGGLGGSPAGTFYSHAAPAGSLGRFTPTTTYHAQHKLTETTGCYTFGAPTPPPGSPYSPLPVTHLEFLTKSFNNNSIIIQHSDYNNQTILNNNNTIHNNNFIKDDQNIKIFNEESEKRWDRNPLMPLSVKTENITTKRVCGCRTSNHSTNSNHSPVKSNKLILDGGCSRTNPVSWTPTTAVLQVKREPALTPACQVSEVTTSNNTVVKVEATSPTKIETSFVQTSAMSTLSSCTTGNGTIPVGIAVARQRFQQELTSGVQHSNGLLTTAIGTTNQIKDIDSTSVATAMTVGVANGGGPIIQCGEDRSNSIASWPLPPTHNSALTAPTLWQYPAPVPIEPILPLPVPIPPVGFQLIRDPSSGQFLLIPTTSFDQLQPTVVWPTYPQPSSHVIIPPIPPPPLAPLQLLGSSTSDYLTTASTTLHQHTQTHSTRLVALTTDTSKRKLPLPAHTLIKIESDCSTPEQTTKTLQTVSTMATNTGTMFTDQTIAPLLTTHVFYQHPTNLIQISQPSLSSETICRSQATSPVACLTPPPESSIHSETEDTMPDVQDASNQTDILICSEDDSNGQNLNDLETSSSGGDLMQENNDPKLNTKLSMIDESQIDETKLPEQVPSTTTIICSKRDNIKLAPIQISAAISSQLTEVRPCIPISIVSHVPYMTEPTSTATIVEIVEPESSSNKPSISPLPENDPVVSTTTKTDTNVDISGLELLSNSIVEFESYRNTLSTTPIKVETVELDSTFNETGDEVVKKIADMSLGDTDENLVKNKKESDDDNEMCQQNDDLGGLVLLCALAEQRIMEEGTEKSKVETKEELLDQKVENGGVMVCESKKLKRCLEERYSQEGKNKKFKVGDFEFERKDNICDSQMEDSPQIKQEHFVEKWLENKYGENWSASGPVESSCDKSARYLEADNSSDKIDLKLCCKKTEWLKMNALEQDMRIRLAELERKCNERELELKQLIPKKENTSYSKKSHKRSKSISSGSDRDSPFPHKKGNDHKRIRSDILKPPILKSTNDNNFLEKLNHVINNNFQKKESIKRHSHFDTNSLQLEEVSSSKKRKIGRPKKLLTPDLCEATEMIVAKKPKSLVGYLLAAKNRLHSQNKSYSSSSPPRYHIEDSPSPKPKLKSERKKSGSKKRLIEKKEKKREKHSSKIRPKLKAEPTVKVFSDEDEASDWSPDSEHMESEYSRHVDIFTDEEKEVEDHIDINIKDEQRDDADKENKNMNEDMITKKDMRCVLTAEHLEKDKIRVLTSMGGLFYAGVLSPIQAPDIYAITLDGERGNRPHIMTREEILRDAIVEVSPESTEELPPGTRLCAYWSQQYRCLYPGTVAEPGTPDPELDGKFVVVEFDDGDNGTIALNDIRLLQPDYPIVEYDPNPLLSLSRRKRQSSTNSIGEDRRSSVTSTHYCENVKAEDSLSADSNSSSKESKKHKADKKERRKVKKHRKDKNREELNTDEKRRKKKHKHDERSKHRKHHKKHRKHKKHHHMNKEKEVDEKSINDEPKDVGELINEELVVSSIKDEVVSENEAVAIVDQTDELEDIEEPEECEELEENEKKSKKIRERQESVESRSKMAAFLPARQLWGWSGKGYKRPGAKGRARKQFYKSIQRGKETITVGDSAVFLSTGRPDRPYIGRIESMWESWGSSMVVKIKWFYHPEETVGGPLNLQYPGALFESPHIDENDVQTISHKCEVLPFLEYRKKLGTDPQRYANIYDNNDVYYRAGYYDPTTTTVTMEPNIPVIE